MKKNASQLIAMEIPSADQSYFWRAKSGEFAFQPESLMEISTLSDDKPDNAQQKQSPLFWRG